MNKNRCEKGGGYTSTWHCLQTFVFPVTFCFFNLHLFDISYRCSCIIHDNNMKESILVWCWVISSFISNKYSYSFILIHRFFSIFHASFSILGQKRASIFDWLISKAIKNVKEKKIAANRRKSFVIKLLHVTVICHSYILIFLILQNALFMFTVFTI